MGAGRVIGTPLLLLLLLLVGGGYGVDDP